MRRSKHPFAQGQIRIAFYGQLARGARMFVSKEKNEIILKSFQKVGGSLKKREKYLRQMEISNLVVHIMAVAYNKSQVTPRTLFQKRMLIGWGNFGHNE